MEVQSCRRSLYLLPGTETVGTRAFTSLGQTFSCLSFVKPSINRKHSQNISGVHFKEILICLYICIRSSVSIVTTNELDGRGSISDRERDLFSPPHPDLLWPPSSQASYPIGTWTPSLGVERPELASNHSHTSVVYFKNAWSCTSIPTYVFMAWYFTVTGTVLPFTVLSSKRNVLTSIGRIYSLRILHSIKTASVTGVHWPAVVNTVMNLWVP
jgi:hypothetical protein